MLLSTNQQLGQKNYRFVKNWQTNDKTHTINEPGYGTYKLSTRGKKNGHKGSNGSLCYMKKRCAE